MIKKRALFVEVWCTSISLNFYLFQNNFASLRDPKWIIFRLKWFLLDILNAAPRNWLCSIDTPLCTQRGEIERMFSSSFSCELIQLWQWLAFWVTRDSCSSSPSCLDVSKKRIPSQFDFVHYCSSTTITAADHCSQRLPRCRNTESSEGCSLRWNPTCSAQSIEQRKCSLADSCASSGLAFWKSTEKFANWGKLRWTTARKTGKNAPNTKAPFSIDLLDNCMLRSLKRGCREQIEPKLEDIQFDQFFQYTPIMLTHTPLSASRSYTTRLLRKSFRNWCEISVLMTAWCWPSSHCIPYLCPLGQAKSQRFTVSSRLQQGVCYFHSPW